MADEVDPQPSSEQPVEATEAANPPVKESVKHTNAPKQPSGKLKRFWLWLKAKPLRLAIAMIVVFLLAGAAVAAATDLRYPVFGSFFRVSAGIKVNDAQTKQPVPHAQIRVDGQTEFTDKKGIARFTGVHPGHVVLIASKTGYASFTGNRTIGFAHRPDQTINLKPNGIKVVVAVTNKLTGQKVTGVEIKIGQAGAVTDANGQAVVSLPPGLNGSSQTVELSKTGYNAATTPTKVQEKAAPVTVALIPAGSVYFISNRSGRLDLYASNLDGSNPRVVLAGTGSEDQETGVLPSVRNSSLLALVSSREGHRDPASGALMHSLFLFNTSTKQLTKLDERVAFVNFRAWIGDALIYEQTPEGQDCPVIKAYQIANKNTTTLVSAASAHGCPKVALAQDNGFFYWLGDPADADAKGTYFIKVNGSSNQRISANAGYRIVQQSRQAVLSESYSGTAEVWESIDLSTLKSSVLPNGPSVETSRSYVDSPGGKFSAFIEERDGKTELFLTDTKGGNEQKLTSMGSVNQFVQWLGDDYIVFSSTKSDENALYIVPATGGTPVKITDFYKGNSRTYGGGYNPQY